MDPIRRKITPNIQPPVTTGADAKAPASKKFDVSSTAPAETTSPTQSVVRPNFDRIQKLLIEAKAQNMSRDQLRDHVIAGEAKHMFGPNATPEMISSVAETFRDDPHLSQLFNRLISQTGK